MVVDDAVQADAKRQRSMRWPVVVTFLLTPFLARTEFLAVTWNYFFTVMDLVLGGIADGMAGFMAHAHLFFLSPVLWIAALAKLAVIVAGIRLLTDRGMSQLRAVVVLVVALQLLCLAAALLAVPGTLRIG